MSLLDMIFGEKKNYKVTYGSAYYPDTTLVTARNEIQAIEKIKRLHYNRCDIFSVEEWKGK